MRVTEETRCGYIAIVGRPNVGKSTLLNYLVEQKISITSRKPQTTRSNVMGVKTVGLVQMIFVDTPGIHIKETKAINRYMNRAAVSATQGVDVVLFVVDQLQWTDEDELVLSKLNGQPEKVIIVVNKIDQLEDKARLMPHLVMLSEKLKQAEIIPLSALKGHNLPELELEVIKRLPIGNFLFPEDQITDKSSRFMAAELVREKIIRQLGAELPYQVAVEIEQFKEEQACLHISALILVEREGQKRIIIGDKGSKIKSIGQAARMDMEVMFDSKVMLKLWVKVKSGWSDDDRALQSLGFQE
jgi:GTPase